MHIRFIGKVFVISVAQTSRPKVALKSMERIRSLISKLQEQFDSGASASQMLVTIQLIQTELSQLQITGHSRLGTSKVAVVLPQVNMNFNQPVEELIAKAIEPE